MNEFEGLKSKFKNNKSPGLCGLTYEMVKCLDTDHMKVLVNIINWMLLHKDALDSQED